MKLALVLLAALIQIPTIAASQRMQTLPVAPQDSKGVFYENPPLVVVRAINKDMNTRVAPPEGFLTSLSPTADIQVTYIGFPSNAQTAFQYAVDIWEALITSSITIKVTARWTALDPGVLGSAGATSLVRDFAGAPVAGTWYPIALAEKLASGDLNSTDSADISARFNSTQPSWYFGTDGNPPPGQFDLVSVVLHELGHGLGFFGSMTVASGMGSWGGGTGFPFIFDRFAENGSGQQLTNTSIFPNPSAALATQLTSNNIFFDGANANAGNGGTPPKLHTPATWTSGSSFSHLDETVFPAGNPNSLMTPSLGTAEAIHSAGSVTLGMFEDWGWTTTPPPPTNIKWEEIFGGTTPPAGWRVVDNDGSGSALEYTQFVAFTSGDSVLPQIGASFWFSNYTNANGSGRIDEYLISPRVPDIETGDSLYFYAGAIGGAFDDSLRVFISTTDSLLGSFTNQIGYFRVDGPVSSWHSYGFDISQFAGEDIFIAVNYFIVDGGPAGTHSDNVWIDHFLITTDNPTSVDDTSPVTPGDFMLSQNYPNPFNPNTDIRYRITPASTEGLQGRGRADNGMVKLVVYDLLGREIATLVNERLQPGTYTSTFDASGLASGVYLYRLQSGGISMTKTMVLMK